MRHETHAGDLLEESLCEYPECDARGGLTCARALEDRASLGHIVREHAGQIRVSRTRPCQRSVSRDLAFVARSSIDEKSGGIDGIRTHDRFPLGPFGITDTNRNRRPSRHSVTDPGEN